MSAFAAEVIGREFPDLAARVIVRTAVGDWSARDLGLLADRGALASAV